MVIDMEIWGNCTICRHPKRAELENTWLHKDHARRNWSLRTMARYFGVSVSALERHCTRHLWLTLDGQTEQISANEYFQDVYDGRSYIEPQRIDVKRKYEQWLRNQNLTAKKGQ
jgi:hypothetical protein